MATLIIPKLLPVKDIENFHIELDFTYNAEKLIVIITDKFPDVTDSVLIQKVFKYSISSKAITNANTYGIRFIDPGNKDGQRQVIYHFDILVDEFVADKLPANFLLQIYAVDALNRNILLYSPEIRKDGDVDLPVPEALLTEEKG